MDIFHLNVRSLFNKFPEFKAFFENHKFDVLAITETWLDMSVSNDSLLLCALIMQMADDIIFVGHFNIDCLRLRFLYVKEKRQTHLSHISKILSFFRNKIKKVTKYGK